MKIALLSLLFAYSIIRCLASQVTLEWDANPEPNISSYELSYGIMPGVYTVTASTDNTLHTFENMVVGQTYYFNVRAKNSLGLFSPPSIEISHTIPKPNVNGWSVKFVSDEQGDGYSAELAIDGDPLTFWHTTWRDGQTNKPMPHELQIDTGKIKTLSGFTYLPRQDSFEHSNIKAYDFYVSLDGVSWGDPVVSGAFTQGKQLSTVNFPSPQLARYLRIMIRSSHGSDTLVSIAELDVIEFVSAPAAAPVAPTSLRVVMEIKIK